MATDRDALDKLSTVSQMDAVHEIRHFLYMPTQSAATEVMLKVAARDFDTEVPHAMLDGSWGVVVRTPMVPEEAAIVALRSLFMEIASEHSGEYDGWEAEVRSP